MEADTWDSVSVAVNNIKMAFVSAGFAVANNPVNNCLQDSDRKLSISISYACKPKRSLNNSNNSINNNCSNNNLIKTNTINSDAGDWNATQTFGNRIVKIITSPLYVS